jgi:hypothetical protein
MALLPFLSFPCLHRVMCQVLSQRYTDSATSIEVRVAPINFGGSEIVLFSCLSPRAAMALSGWNEAMCIPQ